MKKLLALVLAMLMCFSFLAACGKKNAGNNEALTKAVTYLHNLYKDGAKETPVDYDVVGKIVIDGATFTVTWATNNANIPVKESATAGFYTIDVPDKTDAEIPYTITATVKDAKGNTDTKTYERVVPVVDNTAIVEKPEAGVAYKFYLVHAALGKTLYAVHETQNDKYIKTTTDAKAAPDFFVEEVEGGFKFYTMIGNAKKYVTASTKKGEDGKVSKFLSYSDKGTVWYYAKEVNAWLTTIDKTEYVVGTYGTYETMSISESSYINAENTGKTQFPAGLMTKEKADAMPEYVAPEAPTDLTSIKDILAIKEGQQPVGEVIVEGVVSKVVNDMWGNLYIKDKSGNELYIYGLYDSKGEVRYDAMTKKPVVGDTIKVQSLISFYNGVVQLKNAKLLKLTAGAGGSTPSTPSTPGVDGTASVKEGTAYKLFITQVTAGKTLYAIHDTQNNKYIKATTNATSAPDFYVEKVTGGYKFYTTIGGAKKYVTGSLILEDGKDYPSKYLNYSDKGSVWYYKSDVNAWFTKIDGAEYVLGTYGTFETLSISEAKFITADNTGKTQFPVEFIESSKAGTSNPGTPSNPGTGDTPPVKEGVAYKFYLTQASVKKTLYATLDTQNNKYIKTTTNKASAPDFYVEKVTGGYKFYTVVNGAKKYVTGSLIMETGKTNYSKYLNYSDTGSVWYYKKDVNAWFTKLNGAEYVLGTYGTFETMCISDASYITAANTGKTQFPCEFVAK